MTQRAPSSFQNANSKVHEHAPELAGYATGLREVFRVEPLPGAIQQLLRELEAKETPASAVF